MNINENPDHQAVIVWNEEKKVFQCLLGKQKIDIAESPKSKLNEDVWTPEELFSASVERSIRDIFLDYAKKINLEILSYESKAEGIIEKIRDMPVFSEIRISSEIVITSQCDLERVKELIEFARKNCLISNYITCKISIYPEIKIGF